jgi:hypothetical protein
MNLLKKPPLRKPNMNFSIHSALSLNFENKFKILEYDVLQFYCNVLNYLHDDLVFPSYHIRFKGSPDKYTVSTTNCLNEYS